MKTFSEYSGKFLITTTDAVTGKVKYFTQKDVDHNFDTICASCALPVAFPAIEVQGRKYYESVKACEQLEKEGKGIIIRPDHALNSYEEDVSVLRQTYEEGYQKTIDQIDRIQKIL